jgi:serine/threonine-protein kinase
MRICPQCRTAYPDRGAATCTRDGSRLVDARDFAEAQADPLIGQPIGDRYRVVERVGVGGMGTVYRATQAGLERHVAVKVLKKDLTWDRDTVTRFHREARAMSLLTHPNTVRVFDFGETAEGLLYFAMELLEGELLTTKLERQGALEVRDAIRVVQQILRSLAEAHSKGIIHRDLKPDNIYLAGIEGHPEPVVKVLDFGIAKIVQGERMIDQLETQAGTVFGTPRYMSPEQAQGRKLDPRSDLYSVGILLYQLITGRAPFVDDDAVVVMAKHIRERPDAPRDAAPDQPIPITLERVILRAIEKDPARRFKTAERFAMKLESCIADVEREIAGRRSRLGALRHGLQAAPKAPLAAGAAILVLAAAMATFMIARSGEAPPGAAIDDAPPIANVPSEPLVQLDGLIVTSEPPGAEVWSDGQLLGLTPLEMRRPHGSRMAVELRLEGFEPAEAALVADGRPHVVELTALPGERTAEATDVAIVPAEPSDEVQDDGRRPIVSSERARRRAAARRAARRRRSTAAQSSEADAPPPQPVTMAGAEEPYERW